LCDFFQLFPKAIPLPKLCRVLHKLLFLCFSVGVLAQTNEAVFDSMAENLPELQEFQQPQTDPTPSENTTPEIAITDYLIISQARDTTHVDTTLTMAKYYKMNSQRRDNFAWVSLNNSGQALNPLSLETWRKNTAAVAGFRAKESQRFLPHQLAYYHVPTPLSEVFYKSTQSQGQSSDALITANIHPRLNYAIGYRGHRSLGKYQHQISGRSQLRFTTRYENPNGRYRLRLQIANQKIEQQENGGLDAASIEDFKSGDDEFFDRDVLSVRYENADNNFTGKFYQLEQDYLVLRSKDSLQTPRLRVGYRAQSNIQDNRFSQTTAYEGYGSLAEDISKPYDKTHYSLRQFDVYTILTNPSVGWFSGYARHHKYSFTEKHIEGSAALSENAYSVGGEWRKNFGALRLRAEAEFTLSGSRTGDFLNGEIALPWFKTGSITAGIRIQQQHPGFVFERFTSSYADYRWNTSPKMEQRTAIYGALHHPTFGTLSVTATNINNHAYFLQADADALTVTPTQTEEAINLLQLDWEGGLKFGVFRFDAKVRAQQLSGATDAMPLPDLIGRTALYYEDHWFEKAMFLHLGVSAHYFSAFKMRAYHPLLSDFVVQQHEELGGYPVVNAFFNAKIRQTRLFFVVEHANANRKAPDYFAAPGYPHRDLLIRFGIVWNFFQ